MRRTLLAVLVLPIAGCADHGSPLGPDVGAPAFAVVDGSRPEGNPHFFFRPPIVESALTNGDFDPGQSPEVRICRLEADACVEDVAQFTMSDGEGADRVRLDPTEEHYIVNWNAGSAHDGAGLDPASIYRIVIASNGQELGWADVVASSGKGRRSIDGTQYVVVNPGQTLPIKFRIEIGAIVETPALAVERSGLASGQFHSCALTMAGEAWCWGSGFSGQLGHGVFASSATPVQVGGGHIFTSLALGAFHSCGLVADGTVWCWGSNANGMLGTGTTGGFQWTPVQVVGAPPFVQIEAGSNFTCGRTEAGEVHCWGHGGVGQRGDGTTASAASPLPVSGAHVFKAIDAGAEHACGIDVNDRVWCWGGNLWGQLGNGSFTPAFPFIGSTTPVQVSGDMAFASITAGSNHTCALTADGTAWCWGGDFDGQAGAGSTADRRLAPLAIAGHSFRFLEAISNHTCGIDGDGAAWCWGANIFAQTGTGPAGSPARVVAPASLQGGLTWSEIRGGESHSCGITSEGAGMCWGRRTLGTGSTDMSDTPVAIEGGLILFVN